MRELSEHDKALIIDGIPDANLVLFCPGLQGRGSTLIDRSKNANNGTISGATWKRLPSGLMVLNFDGSTGYVDFGSPASLTGLTEMTVSVWFRPAVLKNARLLNKWLTGGFEFSLAESTTTDEATAGKSGHSKTTAALNLVANNWYFLGWTWTSGTTVPFYKNGSLLENLTLPGTPLAVSSSSKCVMGQSPTLTNALVVNGDLSCPRIYSRALTATEFLRQYNRERRLYGA